MVESGISSDAGHSPTFGAAGFNKKYKINVDLYVSIVFPLSIASICYSLFEIIVTVIKNDSSLFERTLKLIPVGLVVTQSTQSINLIRKRIKEIFGEILEHCAWLKYKNRQCNASHLSCIPTFNF